MAPDGSRRRLKLLSTGALRGRVERALGAARLQVVETWPHGRGLLEGLEFRLLAADGPARRVAAYDPEGQRLTLDAGLPRPPPAGAPFELISDEGAPLLAARLLTGTPRGSPLPPARLRLATTLGTNALLERRGAPTAFFVTRGFGDLLRIGTQQRPDLFARRVERPEPLHAAVVEVRERLGASGEIVEELGLEDALRAARPLLGRGISSAAIALAHAYRDPDHERRLRDGLRGLGFTHVSCSHEVAARIKLLPRAETAVVDAYLSPVLGPYLERLAGRLPGGQLLVMTSSGGLLDADGFRPKDSLLSGPAGGAIGVAVAGKRSRASRVIGFDMGGTSTDVVRWDGDHEYVYEHCVGDAHLAAPAVAIVTVAAGGGSVCWLDGERLRVGPHSAGARPGPAAYGAGGPLTLTDVNLLLGRLDPARFGIPVDLEPARRRAEELASAARAAGGTAGLEELLDGLLLIANERMADAIRGVSVRRGYDPTRYALVAFGGAGGQHACGVAERLGIRRVIVPPGAALLSAEGLGHAVVERFAERQVLEPLEPTLPLLPAWFEALAREAARDVGRAGVDPSEIRVRRRTLHLRYAGQETAIEIGWSARASPLRAFERRYAELFGHRVENRPVELESIRVVASSAAPPAGARITPRSRDAAPPARGSRAFFAGRWREVTAYEREGLGGARVSGPALVHEAHSTVVVEPGWSAALDAAGALVLSRGRGAGARRREDRRPRAVRVELFAQRFSAIVREMGERLERTAVSTNVKERLDFSCALLSPDGELVVNAPHIPVHLGALGLCVRRLRETLTMRPGDVVVTNHPAWGGSHLPDVTVVTPAFTAARPPQLLGYLASRAHHAEIGGSRPGSMPPFATCLAEEGVVLPPDHLVRRGVARWDVLQARLEAGPYPTRAIADNLSDLRAALAANRYGLQALRGLAAEHGPRSVAAYMERLKRLAEQRMRAALAALPDGRREAEGRLDDGSTLRVAVTVAGDRATLDFTGCAGVHGGNLNATPAIVRSAVVYVLRLLLDEPLPLNEGLLRPVRIVVAPGILDPPFPEDPRAAPAVGGGNTETSQRIVDTLLDALGLGACSQGTMNNVIFGNARYGYYETLGGGCGAGPDHDGASGVHSHMTNTRITDPEILERRYPIRVERFAIRRGSGGRGRRRGGDGLVRELRFLEPAALSIVSQHRTVAPYGAAGGEPGACGRQWLVREDGTIDPLGPIDGRDVEAGDRLVVETPGGGGYGLPD